MIIGTCPIGVELPQIFQTFGCQVIVLEATPDILGPVDQQLAGLLRQRMEADGIMILSDCRLNQIVHTGQSMCAEYTPYGQDQQHDFTDNLLMKNGQCLFLRRLNEVEPLPPLVEDMVVEKLQDVAADLDGGSGALTDGLVEVLAEFIETECVWRAVEIFGYAPHGAHVDIDGGVRLALASQGVMMLLIE